MNDTRGQCPECGGVPDGWYCSDCRQAIDHERAVKDVECVQEMIQEFDLDMDPELINELLDLLEETEKLCELPDRK